MLILITYQNIIYREKRTRLIQNMKLKLTLLQPKKLFSFFISMVSFSSTVKMPSSKNRNVSWQTLSTNSFGNPVSERYRKPTLSSVSRSFVRKSGLVVGSRASASERIGTVWKEVLGNSMVEEDELWECAGKQLPDPSLYGEVEGAKLQVLDVRSKNDMCRELLQPGPLLSVYLSSAKE